MSAPNKSRPSWSDVKAKLADVDRAVLIGVIQDLYAAIDGSQSFLHARFGLGDDVLKPYKAAIDRWLWPDGFKHQDISVAKAKKAISDYKKAIGRPESLVELRSITVNRLLGSPTTLASRTRRILALWFGCSAKRWTPYIRYLKRVDPTC